MEVKLRSILRTTHWSLLLKAVVTGGLWLATGSGLPGWVFILVALYCYLVPFFRVSSMLFPWTVLMVLSLMQPPTLFATLVFIVLFYCIVGIKELSLIRRFAIHRVVTLALLLVIFLHFFMLFPSWEGSLAFFGSCCIGIIVFIFLQQLSRYHNKEIIQAAVGGLIVWQMTIAMLIVPFSFLYQAAFLFLVATVLFEFLPEGKTPERPHLVAGALVFLALSLAIFGSAQWGI